MIPNHTTTQPHDDMLPTSVCAAWRTAASALASATPSAAVTSATFGVECLGFRV